ncbi:hypothetical protein PMIT1313_00302 [Prochlorococcus marinus str. MIT 1313]|nr:hypothetical protein PMIT1313_00302 [Prochlorococcus marinus str. MIT 1313]
MNLSLSTLILLLLVMQDGVNAQGFKNSIRQCSVEVYNLIEGEHQYVCITKSALTQSEARGKVFLEECKTTYARRLDRWSRTLVEKVVKEECTSKPKDPEIIIEYPKVWP